jgi:hypothetical protein
MAGFGTRGTYSSTNLGNVVRANIDGKAIANTTILSNNSGKNFVVVNVVILTTTVTAYSSAPVINLGITATGYTDIVNAVTGPIAVNKQVAGPLVSAPNIVPNGSNLILRVSTGASATTYTFTVIVEGMFV